MDDAKDLEKTKRKQFWEKRYGRPLTDEDIREIDQNLVGFITTLAKFDKEIKDRQRSEKQDQIQVSEVKVAKNETEITNEERLDEVTSILAAGAIRSIEERKETKKKPSVNAVTVSQIEVACRHAEEMVKAGVTENLAIRTLELFVDVYSKVLMGGSATPHHVKQVKHWSKEALKLKSPETLKNAKNYFRVEHGTPRRELARKVLAASNRKKLDEQRLNELIQRHWKLAVITLEEDVRLNKIARSKAYDSPDERWAAAGIDF